MHASTSKRLVIAAVAAAMALAGCSGDDDSAGDDTSTNDATGGATATDGTEAASYDLVTDGTLTVCSEIPYEPFEFEAEDGSYTGFDIDMTAALAEELGLDVEVMNQSFEGIQSGAALEANTCDIAASAMTITEDREENLDFTDPYFDASQSLLVKADGDVHTLADTAGGDIAVQAETTGAAYAEENAPDDATLVEFPSGADAITALQAGQVIAVLQDLPPNVVAVGNDDNLEVAETYDTGETYGLAVREGRDDGLREDVNEALATLRDNGTYDEIYNTYFETGTD